MRMRIADLRFGRNGANQRMNLLTGAHIDVLGGVYTTAGLTDYISGDRFFYGNHWPPAQPFLESVSGHRGRCEWVWHGLLPVKYRDWWHQCRVHLCHIRAKHLGEFSSATRRPFHHRRPVGLELQRIPVERQFHLTLNPTADGPRAANSHPLVGCRVFRTRRVI
jgi:hypothetical protein